MMNFKKISLSAGSRQLWSACDLAPLWNATKGQGGANWGQNFVQNANFRTRGKRTPSLRENPKRNRDCALQRFRLLNHKP